MEGKCGQARGNSIEDITLNLLEAHAAALPLFCSFHYPTVCIHPGTVEGKVREGVSEVPSFFLALS